MLKLDRINDWYSFSFIYLFNYITLFVAKIILDISWILSDEDEVLSIYYQWIKLNAYHLCFYADIAIYTYTYIRCQYKNPKRAL